MSPFIYRIIQDILTQKYNYKIYKSQAMHFEFCKSYLIFFYWKTDYELSLIGDKERDKIRKIVLNYFVENGYYPRQIEEIKVVFDSDENVQKNYGGNYFYATR